MFYKKHYVKESDILHILIYLKTTWFSNLSYFF